ncbi:ABC transporter permease subunit [Hahella sp. SMD15-11]|uniref:ABC transporter permease subunit n=1 Tax=Thermohahella caldifontis TaxID=3142973 RepID=A0AB39UWL5_9GAMM
MFDLLARYMPSIMSGAWLTIEVAFLSLALAFLLGLVGAWAKLSKNILARTLGTAYTTIIRGVPDLVLMMLIFFGGQFAMNAITDWLYTATEKGYLFEVFGMRILETPEPIDMFINVDPFMAGVFSIGFIYGAYMAETFRGAFMSVERGQIEAGKAYGMRPFQIFSRIMFPQMMRHALPGLGNNWMVILKTTALVSIIGLSDMVLIASQAAKAEHAPFIFFIPVAGIFLALTAGSEWLINRLQNRYNTGFSRG